ncbi:MAG: sigma-70 family RNA polymerase sigma factor [Chloroflexi bacterium]|nr:sigma-70 family RNA polymerase sigma factor [Chloroflexota bacterium]
MALADNAQNTNAQTRQDEAGFESVFLQNYTRVYGVLFRLVGDRAEAEDLALETFWQLWQKPPSRPDNLGGWLYRVATNLGYNALRAAKRRANYEEQAGRDALDLNASPNPEQEAERAAGRGRARDVLRQLPARDAQLLILRHSGLSYKEIAAALNVSPNSIGTLLARAEEEFEKRYSET